MHSDRSLLRGRTRIVPRRHSLTKSVHRLTTSNSILLAVLLAIHSLAILLVTVLAWLLVRLLRLSVRLLRPRLSTIHVSLLKGRWVSIAVDYAVNFVGVCSNLVGWAQISLVLLVWNLTAIAHVCCHASSILARGDLCVIRASKDVDIASPAWRIVYLHGSMSANFTHVVLTCHGSLLILLLGLLLVVILLLWWLLLVIGVCIPIRSIILLLLHLIVLLLVSSIAWGWLLAVSTSSWLSIALILSLVLSSSSLSSLKIVASIPSKTEVATATYSKSTAKLD